MGRRWGCLLLLLLLLLLHSVAAATFAVPTASSDSEVAHMIEFRRGLVDPGGSLQNWNPSEPTPCRWAGVVCVGTVAEVTAINLHGFNLSGTLSPSICQLPRLASLNVSQNAITGPIPEGIGSCAMLHTLDLSTNKLHSIIPAELFSGLRSLRRLFLSENLLYGEIPFEIGNLTTLEELVIYSNNLTGMIPTSIGELGRLQIIRAGLNYLSGPIPAEIGQCTRLEVLGLSQNSLEGPLPKEIQNLKSLTTLIVWQNLLTGEIPPEVGNCTSLEMLALDQNRFTGRIPKELGRLGQLRKIYIYTNWLNGTIPQELGNCSSAVEIDLSENQLTGLIPAELGQLPNLQLLHLFENLLQGSIPSELGKLKLLRKLDLSINNLTGTIPIELQNLTSLEYLQLFDNSLDGVIPPLLGSNNNLYVLDVSDNKLTGTVPAQVCKYQKLFYLSLGSNMLVGNIPPGVKVCKSLVQLRLGGNQLTGSLPIELSSLKNLTSLELYSNLFSGPIHPEIGNLSSLERLLISDNYFIGQIPSQVGALAGLVNFNVSSNRLSGSIPQELANCTKLQRLDISRNRLTGFVPEEIGNLVNLELLKLSDNRLNGKMPGSLGHLSHLTELQMGGNQFYGHIPVELGQISSLQIALNISCNSLSGKIPSELGNLQMLEAMYLNDNQLEGEIPPSFGDLSSLLVCNLSFNKLFGPLPATTAFHRMDLSNFMGNMGLCGTAIIACKPSMTSYSDEERDQGDKDASKEKIISIAAATVGLLSLILTVGICWFVKRGVPVYVSFEEVKPNVSDLQYFPRVGVTYQELVEATGNFAEDAVLGRGACGTVYKAIMPDGGLMAVKKLNSQGESSRVDSSFHAEISTLGNIRHRNIVKLYGFCCHQDSNLILYEYMANGSLGELLHSNQDTIMLDWDTRYRIALGAAEGLCYLHFDCKPQIIHRDIKSNNILLDESFEAHVGDFGLAKLTDLSQSKTMSAIAGSYGYIAPEYAFTMKITEKSDIYSFGVVLFELITGQSPVQPLDNGGDLVIWVRRSIRSMMPTSDLFDSRLDLSLASSVDEMSLVLKIALFCTSESPTDRPTMKEVIAMLIDVRHHVSISPHSPTSETPLDEEASCNARDT